MRIAGPFNHFIFCNLLKHSTYWSAVFLMSRFNCFILVMSTSLILIRMSPFWMSTCVAGELGKMVLMLMVSISLSWLPSLTAPKLTPNEPDFNLLIRTFWKRKRKSFNFFHDKNSISIFFGFVLKFVLSKTNLHKLLQK